MKERSKNFSRVIKITQKKANPRIYNLYKPIDQTSYSVIRALKKYLPKKTKLGHFGTLDPFACGVLMIGVDGAQKLNDYIHQYLPKSYLAMGILGKKSETGDLTEGFTDEDSSEYLVQTIAKFEPEFIEKQLQDKFLGDYWQSPHKYSAAKFEGKPLHEWTRAGVEIKKEQVRREVYELNVVEYDFPRLKIHFKVSSGTYIRTLFADCAEYLGTLGVLEGLERTAVGECLSENALRDFESAVSEDQFMEIDKVLNLDSIVFADKEAHLYKNGVRLNQSRICEMRSGQIRGEHFWVRNMKGDILGLAKIEEDEVRSLFNFS
ncbi:MAG: hypothetical protein CME62_11840 [Halobacteriovoraceae bacterium]|nr:hypothetical protein [Halobacteriovoraceae bacterium]|tara:strand:+ start:4088 stop:5047 length:960 start_codon:yes stop_codon:yes gene_type:complete